jgi:hypothetical protein|nr:MAG TPA: hypothetical protein [Caudoviricetes sp.]
MRYHNQYTSRQDNLISLMLGGVGHHRILPKRVGNKMHITTYSKIDIDDFEESWGIPHICPDMHSGQIPHPRGERLLDTLKAYGERLKNGNSRSATIGCPKKDVEFVQKELLRMIPFGKRGHIWVQPCGAFDWNHLMLVVSPK